MIDVRSVDLQSAKPDRDKVDTPRVVQKDMSAFDDSPRSELYFPRYDALALTLSHKPLRTCMTI